MHKELRLMLFAISLGDIGQTGNYQKATTLPIVAYREQAVCLTVRTHNHRLATAPCWKHIFWAGRKEYKVYSTSKTFIHLQYVVLNEVPSYRIDQNILNIVTVSLTLWITGSSVSQIWLHRYWRLVVGAPQGTELSPTFRLINNAISAPGYDSKKGLYIIYYNYTKRLWHNSCACIAALAGLRTITKILMKSVCENFDTICEYTAFISETSKWSLLSQDL